MKRFTIFGSRLLFWLLAPWVIGGALFFPYLTYQELLVHETVGVLIGAVLSLCCIFFLIMSEFPRLWWLSLFISGSIAGAYVWYFCDTFFVRHQAVKPSLNTAQATPFNAILGFLVWGLPSTIFTVQGVRTLINKRRDHGFSHLAAANADYAEGRKRGGSEY